MVKYWIIVANAGAASIYAVTQEKQTLSWAIIKELSHPASHMKDLDLISDAPGHYKAPNQERGTYSSHATPKQHEAENFAREIANLLLESLNREEFHHLMLAASPHFYGVLNEHLDQRVKNTLKKILQKDYTHCKPQELEEVFFKTS